MRGRALAGPVIERLAAHPAKVFADEEAWRGRWCTDMPETEQIQAFTTNGDV